MGAKRELVHVEHIAQSILLIRGQRVISDSDLAVLYGVTTKRLNEQVKRNRKRFPADFMFQLTADEAARLRSQIATSSTVQLPASQLAEPALVPENRSQIATGSQKHRNPRYQPYVFTEHGAIMAATVLKSEQAIEISVYVVRAFIRLKEMLAGHRELAARLTEIERRFATHDVAIREIVDTIKQLAALPEPESEPNEAEQSESEKPQIGFKVKETPASYRRKKARVR